MRQSIKEVALAAGAGEIIFDQDDLEIDRISPNLPHNFFDIISLASLTGDDSAPTPALPTAGSYTTVVETSENGGYKAISDGGTIAANKTGGTAQSTDDNLGGSFSGNPQRIKITAAGLDVAVAFRVVVRQNSA